jgi:hypothetical protein
MAAKTFFLSVYFDLQGNQKMQKLQLHLPVPGTGTVISTEDTAHQQRYTYRYKDMPVQVKTKIRHDFFINLSLQKLT